MEILTEVLRRCIRFIRLYGDLGKFRSELIFRYAKSKFHLFYFYVTNIIFVVINNRIVIDFRLKDSI
jgi:hypothetical protein